MTIPSPGTGPDPSNAQARLAVQYKTARALAESASLAEAISQVLQAVCAAMDWEHGALWNVDRAAGVLRCAETWQLPSLRFAEFDVDLGLLR